MTAARTRYADAVLAWPGPARELGPGRVGPCAATLADTVRAVLAALGTGAARGDGEREVPLAIWRTPAFRRWHAVQRRAGNRLVGARPVWSFHARSDALFFWALHVTVHIASEARTKDNEIVLSRPDTSHVLLYRRGASLGDTEVVLVREFRSPGSAPDGFVHELPGGSGEHRGQRATALAEVREETGFGLRADRLREHGHRPVAATLSAHHAHLHSAELTDDEMDWFRRQSRPRGVAADSELTWPEVRTVDEIVAQRLVDWPTLGMIFQVLHDVR
ncbi:hypothetical protein [Actinomadura rayongensis]|uniref:hypothetical protein n=1 Tax=Actinomadura rayongensis TaxID=1429076 RepID=UPI00136B87FE